MRKSPSSESGAFNPRILVAFVLCSVGVLLGMVSFAAELSSAMTGSSADSLGESSFIYKQAHPLGGSEKMAPPRPPRVPGTAGWSLVTSPNATAPPLAIVLNGVTCTSASDCWAVGWYAGDLSQALIEHWDGATWSIVRSPSASNVLNDVTCTSASDCWAVGFGGQIEQWNGASWSIINSPDTSSAQLNTLYGVACVSASECWAVGSHAGDSGYQTLIEHWNGTSWSIVASPNAAQRFNGLNAVTCASASDCWAVGAFDDDSGEHTLTEHWDGISWAIIPSANTGETIDYLYAVTCGSTSDCWAVGYHGVAISQTLIEHWDGISWSIVASPNGGIFNELRGVTCASASQCQTVGYYYNGGREQPLIEQWDGTSWSIIASPSRDVGRNDLYSVTCASASECWAVGTSGKYLSDYGNQTLIQSWNGTSWSIVTSPNPSESQYSSQLYGVACASASDCWTVGLQEAPEPLLGEVPQTLIERWDGTFWRIVTSPNPSTRYGSLLVDVTCAASSDCWAIGGYTSDLSFLEQTLIEHWDGSSWSIVDSPNTSETESNYLFSVTCASASDCWTVGSYYNLSGYQTLTEHWDGTSWSIVASPNATYYNELLNVRCASPTQCWAVGYYSNGSARLTLIEHWNGTSWTIVSSPNLSDFNGLRSVTCTSASECWAVGTYYNGTVYQTLIERWDGTLWSIVTSPNTSATQHNALGSVTCASASQCWAIGAYYNGSVDQTLIEHWDGTSWSIVSSPTTSSTQFNDLEAVTCPSASQCWAVGTYYAYSGYLAQTLIEEFSPTIPPLTSVVSSKIHGSAGTFDIDLPLMGTPGIECRIPGATGTPGIDYKVVFNFVNPVTNCGVARRGSAISGPNLNQCTVNLTELPDEHYITVTVNNVVDSQNNAGNISATMGVLLGNITGNGLVNSTDITETQSQSGQAVTKDNFRTDVNVNGLINSTDVSIVQSKSGAGLP